MTKETLEKAQAALANLEAHKRLLEKIKQSGAIAIGPTSQVESQATYMLNTHDPLSHTFNSGILFGLKSDFLANPKIRELCCHFHEELTHIIEEEVASLQSKFENL